MGFQVIEIDQLSTLICGPCLNFIEKMWEFRKKAQELQNQMLSSLSVKRLAVFSPESDTRLDKKSPNTVKCKKTLSYKKVEEDDEKIFNSVFDEDYNSSVTQLFTNNEMHSLQQALRTRQPLAFVHILSKIPRAALAFKRLLVEEIGKNAQTLCKRKSGSVLRDYSYESLEKFNFDHIWKEIAINQPFLVDIFNALAGKCVDHLNTPDATKIKFSFIYSILMFHRWHELSLVQRLNTVLITEGGCSSQVINCISFMFILLRGNLNHY